VPTILVVEDDPIVRNVMAQTLGRLGFRVFEADSANEALLVCTSLKNQPLDLMITDHTLQQTTGRELAESVLECCPNIKILHISVWPYTRMEQENALTPGSSFLQKPFTGGQLATLVQSILTPRTQ
jgi:two-component system, cell cycle sensor histidine kinase and response regulator CckA